MDTTNTTASKIHPATHGGAPAMQKMSQPQWSEMKAKIKNKWSRFNDQELETFRDHLDLISAQVQKSFGVSKDQAEREFRDFTAANPVKPMADQDSKISAIRPDSSNAAAPKNASATKTDQTNKADLKSKPDHSNKADPTAKPNSAAGNAMESEGGGGVR